MKPKVTKKDDAAKDVTKKTISNAVDTANKIVKTAKPKVTTKSAERSKTPVKKTPKA